MYKGASISHTPVCLRRFMPGPPCGCPPAQHSARPSTRTPSPAERRDVDAMARGHQLIAVSRASAMRSMPPANVFSLYRGGYAALCAELHMLAAHGQCHVVAGLFAASAAKRGHLPARRAHGKHALAVFGHLPFTMLAVPTKRATKLVRGRSYTSAGVPTCSEAALVHHGNAVETCSGASPPGRA